MKFYKTVNGRFLVQTYERKELRVPQLLRGDEPKESWEDDPKQALYMPTLSVFSDVDGLCIELAKQGTRGDQPEDNGDGIEELRVMAPRLSHTEIGGAVLEVNIGKITGGFIVTIDRAPEAEKPKARRGGAKKARLSEFEKIEFAANVLLPVFKSAMAGRHRSSTTYAFTSWGEVDNFVREYVTK